MCLCIFVCLCWFMCMCNGVGKQISREDSWGLNNDSIYYILYCVASAPIKLWKEEETTPCEIFYLIHQDIAIIQHLTKYAQNNLTILHHIITNAVILIQYTSTGSYYVPYTFTHNIGNVYIIIYLYTTCLYYVYMSICIYTLYIIYI